jgi:hypothetical protein
MNSPEQLLAAALPVSALRPPPEGCRGAVAVVAPAVLPETVFSKALPGAAAGGRVRGFAGRSSAAGRAGCAIGRGEV